MNQLFIDALEEITESCPGTTRLFSKYIISTNYPNKYPINQDCSWTIKAKDGDYIKLSIPTFNLGRFACYDYVDIFNVSNGRHVKIGRYCANNIPTKQIVIYGNVIRIDFLSSNMNNYDGFKIGYAPVKPGYFLYYMLTNLLILHTTQIPFFEIYCLIFFNSSKL